ncbi:chemotaxis response regulator protein-glutamate methylesterase [Thalassospiraceae bacterium LMO-SO8]|nr:chemotaxis response regulator protein-glutamate methylesterase [Alphaproteobacteria bacterium LMO-S08]WND74937.1 chemotaxis response regulator protein-glutamate methylesterase [Thalassospiraceae bacterium LMO-SO8]
MTSDEVRVMLVDDSAVIRGLIARMIEGEPGLRVAASVGNGQMAVDRLKANPVDVIILDIEMPVMDGLTAIPKLLEIKPDVKIIMASTLTEKNADISLRALQAGATDYVPKPTATREISGGETFKHELLEKIRQLGLISRRPPSTPGAASAVPVPKERVAKPLYEKPVQLRTDGGTIRPRILAVGSSTGGPQALFQLFKDIRPDINIPVVVTQHMPATFTTILAEHIAKASGWPCAEATDGMSLQPGHIYVAPGNFHMTVEKSGTGMVIRTNQDPPENFCRPSVDPMLRSLAAEFGGAVLTVILTGMGHDGRDGAKVLVEAGGTVIAQDEASSVVWGMPGAVATAGLCNAVLPLKDLGPHVMSKLRTRAA